MGVVAPLLVLGLSSVLADEIFPHRIHCALPNCNLPCRINLNAKPCPRCECSPTLPNIQCSEPKCNRPCNTPCPSCECRIPPQLQCSLPKCDPPCRINHATKPCPICECHSPPEFHCSMPKCNRDCKANFSTKPCPSCDCTVSDHVVAYY
ncbi:small proline-rich protein 2D-like [Argiope bruennichi]|uniref:small proline-rich protein 2D-like n=1 Tax=Argiope bruennichi TaxID=94029 RepID=UPI002494ADDC|nr:small proline-rich protein 2D-like [Argiope bruennichi]